MAGAVRRFQQWLFGASSRPAFLAVIATAMLLRVGISAAHADPDLLAFSRSFPTPAPSFASYAVVSPALGHVLGLTTASRWLALHVVLVALALLGTAVLLRRGRSERAWRVVLAWVTLSSAPAVNLQWVGFYDVWTLAGGALVAAGAGLPTAVCGGLVLGATNAEQGLVGLLALAVVVAARYDGDSTSVERRVARRRLVAAAVSTVAARIAVTTWFASTGVSVATRWDSYGETLQFSLRNALRMGTAGVYGWYGVAWVAVVLCIRATRSNRRTALLMTLGLVVIPALVTVTTADGTRVFASVSWPPLLAALIWRVGVEDSRRDSDRLLERWAATGVLASPVAPSVVTDNRGVIQAPWSYVADKLFG